MSDTEAKIREMAKLSILSNRISEVHEKNLRAYAFIFFNDVKETEIQYDLERGSKNFVIFKLTLKDSAENTFLDKRFYALDRSIKNLFWKEINTIVYMNGKKVFDSESVEKIAEKVMDDNRGLFENLAELEEREKNERK